MKKIILGIFIGLLIAVTPVLADGKEIEYRELFERMPMSKYFSNEEDINYEEFIKSMPMYQYFDGTDEEFVEFFNSMPCHK